MAVKPYKGKWVLKWYRKQASTAYTAESFVAFTSGEARPAVAGSTALGGICLRTVASTDADYADNTRIPVAVPASDNAEFLADVGTGTMAVGSEGSTCDLKDADELDVSATSTNVVFLSRFISTTQALGQIAKLAGDN